MEDSRWYLLVAMLFGVWSSSEIGGWAAFFGVCSGVVAIVALASLIMEVKEKDRSPGGPR